MSNDVRNQILTSVVAALTGLPTSGARVFASRVHEMQGHELPGLRVYAAGEDITMASHGVVRRREHRMELVVECCAKAGNADAQVDAMVREVRAALDSAVIASAKWIEPRRLDIEIEGDAERNVGVGRITHEVLYYTARGAPDVAL